MISPPCTCSSARELKSLWVPEEIITVVLHQDINATFFFVEDNPAGGIDPIRNFLLNHEESIRALFHYLLKDSCGIEKPPNLGRWGTRCPPEDNSGRSRLVVDVGANRGFYTFLSAALGHRVLSFDPQPHCASLLTLAVALNGFDCQIEFHNKYVSNKPDEKMVSYKRTGCVGTYPNDNDNGWGSYFRRPLTSIPGANDEIEISGVSLDDLLSPSTHDIILLKIDVEGHESHVFQSAEKLIDGGAVQNILVELNMPMMKRQVEGFDIIKKRTLSWIRWILKLGFKCKGSHLGHWTSQDPQPMRHWEQLMEDGGFVTADMWCYKPHL